ncbi:NAD-dependent epimerase/dehydratase family protein [Cohnella lupini]|uniref:2'-hydroxyisoflavone reductase n=1 Tax=Cohnella lupini TaxID=1294267 RepID=A0A3D9HZ29_9BACL|nr:NAD-dependent epimerase/dehydratase family protein [Cohnella lupini]RED54685.1 2'-hydroxyisoflavone reductase [Cohnella lupini]
MKILILGGTVFLGHHLVHSAVRAGHEVTIFSRGITRAESVPDGVEKLIGNRDGNLDALAGKRWDAVIDTSGYVPRVVRLSAKLLATVTDHYTFISSVSVYRDFLTPGIDETGTIGTLSDPSTEDVGSAYGQLKALCEQAVEQEMPGRALVIRPGLIVGPLDPTDRFTYWPSRIRRGCQVLAPGTPDASVQIIDARDLADWTIRMIESKATGVYNAAGPTGKLTMASFLDQCRQAVGSDSELVWVDNDFLLKNGIGPWIEMPLWIPGVGETEQVRHLLSVNAEKALAAGLTFRPLKDTILDTLQWDLSRDIADRRVGAGMDAAKEERLLNDWLQSRD